ncbi:MAG: hypothetical protein JNK48_25905 [Bryobacterales bacterium]|nr:hypothetical protein [Bryobacterales bacterium]
MLIEIALLFVSTAHGAVVVNSSVVNPDLFRVTTFATGLPASNSVALAADGSIYLAASPAGGRILRFTDTNADGIADGAGTIVYQSNAGPLTQLRQTGKYYAVGEFGARRITFLEPGAMPADAMTPVGSLQFSYPTGWAHPTIGMATRPTPGSPGSYDFVFNIGSQTNATHSTGTVTVSGLGLGPVALQGESLYMITIDESGAVPVASNLRTVATGIRNVYGMGFHPVTGDLYFADNAIDELTGTTPTSTPPQVDELNRISAADVGVTAPNFGFPGCYVEYGTGSVIGDCTGVAMPIGVFQPIPNPPAGGRSEGPTEIAFAPSAFPGGWNNGVFVGFSGKNGLGPVNDENAVAFYSLTNGSVRHFLESGQTGVGNLVGVFSTSTSLFVADWGAGKLYQIAVEPVPEPGYAAGVAALLAAGVLISRRRGA